MKGVGIMDKAEQLMELIKEHPEIAETILILARVLTDIRNAEQ